MRIAWTSNLRSAKDCSSAVSNSILSFGPNSSFRGSAPEKVSIGTGDKLRVTGLVWPTLSSMPDAKWVVPEPKYKSNLRFS